MISSKSTPVLEVCCGDIESVLAAKKGGARRIELCSALSEGGITPSAGLVAAAMASGIETVHVLIRPRGGDFLYSEAEIEVMIHDIREMVKAGVDGIVIGALTENGDIDIQTCRRLIKAANGIPVTFHRAFDLCREPEKALEDIISLGCDRLLTSGLEQSAFKGCPTLRRLNDLADGRIIILAGGGISPQNAAEIIRLTGVRELHASAKTSHESQMKFRRNAVNMGASGKDEYSRQVTDPAVIAEIIREMGKVSSSEG